MKTKFEYKIVEASGLSEMTLNNMGSYGWELVTVVPKSSILNVFYFKKPTKSFDKMDKYHPEMKEVWS